MYDYMIIYSCTTYGSISQGTGQLFVERETRINTREDVKELEQFIKQMGEYSHVLITNYKLMGE